MNTTSLKSFAPKVRLLLQEAITRKLDYVLSADTADLRARAAQVQSLRKQAERDRTGLLERVASTWFNRFAALRFLDAKGWHPFAARVLTPATPAETQPELLKLTRNGSLPAELASCTDPVRLNQLLDGLLPSADPQGEVYRHLVLAACHAYHKLLPHLFAKIDDETELLLPDDLLTEHSVVQGFRTEISDEDCATVEVLGWLYQFYISDKKDAVMARKSAVPTEDIPAVTQLFTPHWIVRYLVENSLGRLWLLNRPGSGLRQHMPYYIESGESESGAGVPPASPSQEAGKMPAPLSFKSAAGESGAGVPPAFPSQEAGKMPAPLSFEPFNPWEEVETPQRRLPHWHQEGTTYFVTFRLHDSIPQEKLGQWEAERKQWLSTHPEPWDEKTTAEYNTLFPERRQQWLDNGYGRCLLKLPALAEIVRSALLHFDGQRYVLDEFVLMPNHVHLLVKPLPGNDLSSLLHTWKSFTAKAINKAIGATGTVWQDESYDHIVRSSSQLEFYRNYIRENPVKARLTNVQSQRGAGIQSDIESGCESGAGVPPAFPPQEAGKMPAPLFLRIAKPEDIQLIDPACGSGHMLTYAFDLLALIYEEEGYAPSEIPALILRHNLHGVDICPRAAQLAELALVFKAREKSRRFLQPGNLVRPRILTMQDVAFEEAELTDYIAALDLGDLFNKPVLELLSQFEHATTFGALIQPCLDEKGITALRSAIEVKDLSGQLFLSKTHEKVLRVLEQAEALSQRYHVVVANPPYMGSGNFNRSLRNFLEPKYKVTRTDLFAIFLERNFTFIYAGGFLGMVTMQSWMFTTSYLELREKILTTSRIGTLAQLGARAFDSISGEIVATVAFCITRATPNEVNATFIRLTEDNSEDKHQSLLKGENRFVFDQREFKRIPGSPLVYWKGFQLIEVYESFPSVGSLASFREGIHTGDNPTFLRQWWEVPRSKMSFNESSYASLDASGGKWIPYNKGGGCVRWYGNFEYVLAFDSASRDAMALLSGHVRPSQSLYFKRGGTWSDVGTKGFGVKFYPEGFLFADKGPVVVGEEVEVLIAGLNSSPFTYMCELLMPTISYRCGTVKTIPFPTKLDKKRVAEISATAITLSRANWDNFEISWDFLDLPLLRPELKAGTLEASWSHWEAHCTAAIRRMQELETENNRLFIEAYGLTGELTPEVPEDQITLARADRRKDVVAFLSYAVGCMMGRYSLDHPGLILANAGDTLEEYWKKVGQASCLPSSTQAGETPAPLSRFTPDEDGILPVLDGEWFEDDIVSRTRDFLRATFGEATLAENLRFIEEALGKDLRKYFLTDFYKDHLSNERAYGYKKRPIYWLFTSGKKGFSALVYLHRYTKDTVNRLLNGYLREYLHKLRARIEHLEHVSATSTNTREKTSARKEGDALKKTLRECEDYERDTLLPLAQARLELDLDDGVKVNYLKLGEALAPIAGLAAKEEE